MPVDPDVKMPREATLDELVAFQERGGVLVGGTPGGKEFYFSPGDYYTKPSIDGKSLLAMTENAYVFEPIDKLVTHLFVGEPMDHVFGPDGKENPELSLELNKTWESDIEDKFPGEGRFNRIKLAFKDIVNWGTCPVQIAWDTDNGRFYPTKVVRLPPESFIDPPSDAGIDWQGSPILKGIGLRKGILECWQTWSDGQSHLLRNVILLKDPLMPGIAGKSRLIPIFPLSSLMSFAWKTQGQKLNRVGAPIMFIKFTSRPLVDANRDDPALAKLIIENWGKDSQFALRENMEPVFVNFNDNQDALKTIERLSKDLTNYFNPASFLQKEGSTIGGNDAGKIDFIQIAIHSMLSTVESQWRPISNKYLELNGYEGYVDKLEMPEPQPDRTEINLRRAEAADKMGIATLNEKRRLAGLPEATPEELAEIEEERNQRSAMTPGTKPYGQNEDAESDGEEGGRPQENFQDSDGEPEMNLFPYPSEHAGRVRSPDDFEENSFRRKNIAPGVDIIIGKINGKMVTQAYRFKKGKFTASEARAWLKKRGIHTILFEPAKGV